MRQSVANGTAFGILAMLAAAALGLLAAGILIISIMPLLEAEAITRFVAPYIQALGKFTAIVFGPLVTFILGYYRAARRWWNRDMLDSTRTESPNNGGEKVRGQSAGS